MAEILAFYGSPRRRGNSSTLLARTVEGVRSTGAEVEEIFLRDLTMSPCLEIYGCLKTGRCVMNDDFQAIYDKIVASRGIILASPVFFYTVSSHTKILMDRCQSFWVKKYWIDKIPFGKGEIKRRGLFISVGATRGKRLFDGVLLTVRYFFDAIDTELWDQLLFRRLDLESDILEHPEYLDAAYRKGIEFARALGPPPPERPGRPAGA